MKKNEFLNTILINDAYVLLNILEHLISKKVYEYSLQNSNLTQKGLLMQRSKKIFFIKFCLFLIFILTLSSSYSFSATPQLVKTLTDAFEDIEDWILKLATPAAAVAVGVGLFMKKFSFGDEEKMRTAKKVIRGSLFAYGFVLAINLVLSAIESLIT